MVHIVEETASFKKTPHNTTHKAFLFRVVIGCPRLPALFSEESKKSGFRSVRKPDLYRISLRIISQVLCRRALYPYRS